MQQSTRCNNQPDATIKQLQQSSKCNHQAGPTVHLPDAKDSELQESITETTVLRINSLLEVKVNQKTV
jgi:hypothetical protein